MELDVIIREAIRQDGGRIPFERFMELALYHPEHGYYTKQGPSPVGKQGDFVTSVSLGPLFGKILAKEITRFRETLNQPDFCLVEYGAHRGALRAHILEAIPDLPYVALDCAELSPTAIATGRRESRDIIDAEPEAFTGCVLANEFLDALPVHRVRVSGGQWLELYVEENKERGSLQECLGPLSSPRIADRLSGLPVHLMEGFTTEVNVRAVDWLENIARRLTLGYVMIIDYGHERMEYLAPHRSGGTMTCYRDHRRGENPLLNPGHQDITSHVEFSSFMERAKTLGFRVETFQDQGRFLLKTGEGLIRELIERDAGRFSAARGTLNQLTHPSMMGQAFKVLILKKDA